MYLSKVFEIERYKFTTVVQQKKTFYPVKHIMKKISEWNVVYAITLLKYTVIMNIQHQ